jgi:hypothetical protein
MVEKKGNHGDTEGTEWHGGKGVEQGAEGNGACSSFSP